MTRFHIPETRITKIEKYVPNSDDMLHVSRAGDTGVGRAIMTAVRTKLEEELKEVIDRPRRNLDDITQNVDYILGFIAGMKWVESIPDNARKYIEKIPEESWKELRKQF